MTDRKERAVQISRTDAGMWQQKVDDFGQPFQIRKLIQDPDTGLYVEWTRYEPGTVTRPHRHTCSHGIYVLSGRLLSNGRICEAGTMLWYPAGSVMDHGATSEEACETLFLWSAVRREKDGTVTAGHDFDIEYVDPERFGRKI